MRGRLLRSVVYFCLLLTLSAGILGCEIYLYSLITNAGPADAAVVLGAAVWNNQPSPVFRERINHAIALYKSRNVRFLIFTGGVGQGDSAAESTVAKAYAVQQGVPAGRVLTETHSEITFENLAYARPLLDAHAINTVLVVSDPLHMRRAMVMAHDLGIKARPSPTPTTRYISWASQSRFLSREVYFLASYRLHRLWHWIWR